MAVDRPPNFFDSRDRPHQWANQDGAALRPGKILTRISGVARAKVSGGLGATRKALDSSPIGCPFISTSCSTQQHNLLSRSLLLDRYATLFCEVVCFGTVARGN